MLRRNALPERWFDPLGCLVLGKCEGSLECWDKLVGTHVHRHGFHGHYASFDLKDRRGMFHTNMEKFGDIHDQLVSKIAALAVTPASAGGEAIPLRIDIPPTASIELWDSGLPVSANASDTLPSLATTYHVPLWVLTQVNNLSEAPALTKGARIIVPRYLIPTAAPSAVSSHASKDVDYRQREFHWGEN